MNVTLTPDPTVAATRRRSIRRAIARLEARIQWLWDHTQLGPAPDYGYATRADELRELERQRLVGELQTWRASLARLEAER